VVVFGGGLDGLVGATYVAASLALLLLVWLLFAYASRIWATPEPASEPVPETGPGAPR
jgi:hypothetical protein